MTFLLLLHFTDGETEVRELTYSRIHLTNIYRMLFMCQIPTPTPTRGILWIELQKHAHVSAFVIILAMGADGKQVNK